MELFKAAAQWSTRPADERFWDVTDALEATQSYARAAIEKETVYGDLRVEAAGPELLIMGKSRIPARLSHHAFGQLSGLAGAPASYLRDLPPTLAAQNINHGLKARTEKDNAAKAQLLFHVNGTTLLRAITSESYARIWNYEVFERMVDLRSSGWRVPPGRPCAEIDDPRARPATEADILRGSNNVGGQKIRVGDMIAPAGVYASDHDMFAFLVNEDRRIDDGSEDGLVRGVFFWNSEVGSASFGMKTFLMKGVCGNHIVWGAQGVKEVRIRHVGERRVRRGFNQVQVELRKYASAAASEDERRIGEARKLVLGATKEEALEVAFSLVAKKRINLSQKILGEGLDLAETRVADYGHPRSVWALGNALTELSQKTGYAEDRVAIDNAAGRLMAVATF